MCEIIWLAPDGSYGGCDCKDLTVVKLAEMTEQENADLQGAIECGADNDVASIILSAADRIKEQANA